MDHIFLYLFWIAVPMLEKEYAEESERQILRFLSYRRLVSANRVLGVQADARRTQLNLKFLRFSLSTRPFVISPSLSLRLLQTSNKVTVKKILELVRNM